MRNRRAYNVTVDWTGAPVLPVTNNDVIRMQRLEDLRSLASDYAYMQVPCGELMDEIEQFEAALKGKVLL